MNITSYGSAAPVGEQPGPPATIGSLPSEMEIKRKPSFIMLALATVGVAVGVMARQPIVDFFSPSPQSRPTPPQIKLPPPPEKIAKPHLSWADQESERVLADHLRAIDTFFTDSQKHTRPFAEEALSWASKWRLIVDYVAFTSGGRHETFIRGKFEEYVFKPAQLEGAVKQVVSSYLQHIESIEGQMLVRIKADVADFPSAFLIAQIDGEKLQVSYKEALERAINASGSSLRTDVATELVSFITGEVLTQVAVRMGVSAGILATGAGSSWATLGIGLVVGLIVDQIVSWVWDWYADPKGSLADEIDAKLDEMNHLIVDGSGDVQGLRERLLAFAKDRAKLRSQAVLTLLQHQ